MLAATLPTTTPFGPPAVRPALVQPHAGRRLHAFGNQLDLVLTRADTGGALAAWFAVIPPDNGPPPHVHHREAEVIFVLEGALDFFAGAPGGAGTRVAAGGAAFLPAGVPHTFRNAGAAPARTLTVALPGGCEEFFAQSAEVFAAAGPGAPPNVADLLRAADAHGMEFLVPPGAGAPPNAPSPRAG